MYNFDTQPGIIPHITVMSGKWLKNPVLLGSLNRCSPVMELFLMGPAN
jgi:hypothetical protein